MHILCVKAQGAWKDKVLLDSIGERRGMAAPKSTLRIEALRAAGAQPDGAWVQPALELVQGLKRPAEEDEEGGVRQYQVPLSEEDEGLLQKVREQIKGGLGLQRVQTGLVFRLALACYLQQLERGGGVVRAAETIGEGSVDVFTFWLAYKDACKANGEAMEELRNLCRRRLDTEETLYIRLREAANAKLRALADLGVDKLLGRGATYATADIRFLSKALAGICAVLAEIEAVPIAAVIAALK